MLTSLWTSRQKNIISLSLQLDAFQYICRQTRTSHVLAPFHVKHKHDKQRPRTARTSAPTAAISLD